MAQASLRCMLNLGHACLVVLCRACSRWLLACGRRLEMMLMPVVIKAEFRYVPLVGDSMLVQFYVRFVDELCLLLPGLHWHPRAMPFLPALCFSWRPLPMLHCRPWCGCSASSCCRPLGFRRLGAHRQRQQQVTQKTFWTCCVQLRPTMMWFMHLFHQLVCSQDA